MRKPNSERDLEFIRVESEKAKLCKCGCGEAITILRHHVWKGVPDYVKGHSSRVENGMKGKHHTEEALRKMSAVHLGKPRSEEHKRKISESQKGRMHTPQNAFKKGNTINAGHKHSEETKRKMSIKSTGRIKSPETRRKISESNKGRVCSAYQRQRTSETFKGKPFTEEHRRRIADDKREKFKDPAFSKKMGIAWGLHPNKPETLVLRLLDDLYPGEWKYTGDFSFTINGKSPDFTNCNGQKKLIELFGSYWHEGENPQDRVDTFAPFGFQTLVIWEHELKNINEVATRIQDFHEAA